MRIIKFISVTFLIMTMPCWVAGNQSREEVYLSAIKEEVQRGMEELILDGMLPPGFISYHIVDANILQISSVLGGIVRSEQMRTVRFDNRVMVIKDGISNENYIDIDNLSQWSRHDNSIPVTGCSDDVRRALWLTTDEKYKAALNTYESKISAMQQQNLSLEEMELPDLLPADTKETVIPWESMNIDKVQLENLASSISSVFSDYNSIISSRVNIYVYDGQVFYYNSEGTLSSYPFQVAGVVSAATAYAQTGELLFEHSVHFAANTDLIPSEAELVSDAVDIALKLEKLSTASPVKEPYFGPVLFEGEAVAEIFSRVFFGDQDGLVAIRRPVIGDEQMVRFASDWIKENNLEARLGNRIISEGISIYALPGLHTFNEKALCGRFDVDAEGLPVADSVNLVENGILTNLLSSRTPTLRIRESNAHARLAIDQSSIRTTTAPGVVKMSVTEEMTYSEAQLKEMLIDAAIDEGLDYAYIVRKVFSPMGRLAIEDDLATAGQVHRNRDGRIKTLRIYRVDVSDGSEELVTLADIKDLNIRTFRRVVGASPQMQVYNTMFTPSSVQLYSRGFNLTGTPVSYIVPGALLFEELDIVGERQQFTRRPPVVGNPVGR